MGHGHMERGAYACMLGMEHGHMKHGVDACICMCARVRTHPRVRPACSYIRNHADAWRRRLHFHLGDAWRPWCVFGWGRRVGPASKAEAADDARRDEAERCGARGGEVTAVRARDRTATAAEGSQDGAASADFGARARAAGLAGVRGVGATVLGVEETGKARGRRWGAAGPGGRRRRQAG